jgi:hypothetical protein
MVSSSAIPTRAILSWLMALSFVIWEPALEAAEVQPVIAIEAKISPALDRGRDLEISITNPGNQAITMFKANLPWSTRHSLLLVAVTADRSARRLNEALYVDDPSPGAVTVPPSQVLSGHIDLDQRFPELNEARKHSEIILFWSYETELLNNVRTNRVSGTVVIPQSKP